MCDAPTFIPGGADRIAYLQSTPAYAEAMRPQCSTEHAALVDEHIVRHGNGKPPSLGEIQQEMNRIIEAEQQAHSEEQTEPPFKVGVLETNWLRGMVLRLLDRGASDAQVLKLL